jgi:hypothetical protein
MMTHVVALWRGPTHNFPGAWIFVVVVLAIIVLIFVRVYGPRSWTWRLTGRRGRRTGQTVHRVSDHEVHQNRAKPKGRP